MDKDFDNIKEDLTSQGYKLKSSEYGTTDVYLSPLLILHLVAAVFFINLYLSTKHPEQYSISPWWEYPLLMIAMVFVHELIHGICFAIFSKKGFKSVKFGLSKQSLYFPYCHCKTTVSMVGYLVSAMMPFIILGIVAAVISFITHISSLYLLSLAGIFAGSADVLFSCELLKQKKILSPKGQIHVYDYVDKMGFAVFYKEKDVND